MTRLTTLKRIREEARDHHKCAGALDPLMVRHRVRALQRETGGGVGEREIERKRENEREIVCVCTGNAGELPVPLAL